MAVATPRIDLVNIDKELKRLAEEELGKNKTRACFFNLVIFAQKAPEDSIYKTLIESVISKFPCRVIAITADKEAKENFLKTSVATLAVHEGIFCEVIQIDVAGALLERVPFIILPHILADLPLYLLWALDPSQETTVLPSLEPYATRVIFDPKSIENLQSFSQNVISQIKEFQSSIGDLNWSALNGWRKIFAETFHSKENFQALAKAKIIRITYAQKNNSSKIRAAYFQAWLSSTLAWRFSSIEKAESHLRLTYKLPESEVAILLIAQDCPDELPSGALLSIEIESQLNCATYSFKRAVPSKQVYIQRSDKYQCDLPYCTSLSGMSEGQEIIDEIFYPASDKPYLAMLQLLTLINWKSL